MNFIQSLQHLVAEQERERKEVADRFNEVRCHLCSAKFRGFDTDGERKDWIATGDVFRLLSYIETGVN